MGLFFSAIFGGTDTIQEANEASQRWSNFWWSKIAGELPGFRECQRGEWIFPWIEWSQVGKIQWQEEHCLVFWSGGKSKWTEQKHFRNRNGCYKMSLTGHMWINVNNVFNKFVISGESIGTLPLLVFGKFSTWIFGISGYSQAEICLLVKSLMNI